jgi:RND family efflux transporter MFP subunit
MGKSYTFLALVVSMALSGCQEEAKTISLIRPVRTLTAHVKPLIEQRNLVGEIRPRHESSLSFQVSGKIVSRSVNAGDKVKAGDIVAKLDPQDYIKKMSAAQADVDSAEASFTEAQAAELRSRTLLKKGFVAKANYDTALRNLRAAEASLASARIALSMAADQLSYTELKAEADGIITSVSAEPEQVVSSGQAIVALAPSGELDAVFSVAEAVLHDKYFEVGKSVKVALLSDPEVLATGEVREVSPVADPATRTFEVKVSLSAPPQQMHFGSSVTGQAIVSQRHGVTLPGSAIFDEEGRPAVWIVDPATEQVALRPVAVAHFDADTAVISSGISSGEVIVTAGANQLRQGEKVKLLQE